MYLVSVVFIAEECKVMMPLIDRELEQVDKKHNELMVLNQKLIDSFQMYTKLMTEAPQYSTPNKYMYSAAGVSVPSGMPGPQQQPGLQQTPTQQPAYQPQTTYSTLDTQVRLNVILSIFS